MLDFVCLLAGGISESETGRTYWKCVDGKCARNHDLYEILHRLFYRLQELVFVRLDIQTVCYFHDQRAGHT